MTPFVRCKIAKTLVFKSLHKVIKSLRKVFKSLRKVFKDIKSFRIAYELKGESFYCASFLGRKFLTELLVSLEQVEQTEHKK